MPTAVTSSKKKKKKKMEAAAALLAELKFRDGVKEQISVKVENNLTSLIAAVQELNGVASRLLSELVEREKSRGHTGGSGDNAVSITRASFLWLCDLPGYLSQVRKRWRTVMKTTTGQRSR